MHTSIYVFFLWYQLAFRISCQWAKFKDPEILILLFGGHEIATPTRWGIAMITTSTDLPIYTLNLFKGTQVSVISTALHVLEVQDSVAWAKGSIFKNDSIERIGQSLDTAEKSKLTLPSVYIPLPFPLQLLPSYWMVGNMRCLKATMKDLTSFCRHSIWQHARYQLLNSQLLYGSIPACQATVKSGVHVFASLWP